MPGVIGDDSGFPKRCFTWTFPNGEKFTFCIVWLEWPSVIWRHIKPDPGPERVQIEGVSPEILRDIEIVDTISWLSTKLSPELGKSLNAAAKEGLGSIQKRLPSNLSLTSR